jgi:hypothetical protein
MATTQPRTNDLLSLLTHWHLHKRETTFAKRLGMRSLEVISLAAAMLVVPATIHQGVRSLDEVYELLGRRARSPYTSISWLGIILAVVLMLGWHIWLGRLSYRTLLDKRVQYTDHAYTTSKEREQGKQEERISWGRILGRIFLPLLLLLFGLHFAFQIAQGLVSPRELVVKNTVDMQEAVGQLYGFK